MAFHVGQKVVCVGWNYKSAGEVVDYGPRKGDKGTICNVYSNRYGTILELIEWPTPVDHLAPGWEAKGFRPLIENSTDTGMAILREILDRETDRPPVKAKPLNMIHHD